MSENYIFTTQFNLGTINRNSDIFTNSPDRSGVIILEYKMNKEEFDTYQKCINKNYISIECRTNPDIEDLAGEN